ncbi:hypothetical protein [Ewingella americana]|uniref:hypothetical protein n=1 Tax=Ewingella americana TaxID=41202 RepID=UPI0012AD3DDE|nr:hypothetical protein [Ewingella americana]MRT06039.1 hypothetical protein [Ewingella americana]
MLTQKIIREEIEDLKLVMQSDSLTVPSFWDCVKPGLLLMFWMAICPFLAFYMSNASPENILVASGFSAFLGFIMLFWITNARAIILSIPENFRENSKVINFLYQKVKRYTIIYMLTILILAFLGAYSNTNGLLYLMPMMLALFGFAFFFNADISRYKLSAFTEIIKAAAVRKNI